MSKETNFDSLDDVLDPNDVYVTLDLDDNITIECKAISIFEANGQDYIALLPLDEDGNPNEDGEVFLYRYFEDEEGNPSIDMILDDEEFEIASDRFDEIQDEAEFDEM